MEIPIRYGKDDVFSLKVNDENVLGVFNPNEVEVFDETKLIQDALARPVGQHSFDEFIAGDDDLVIIVNDGTRPTPTAKVLKEMYPKIRGRKKTFIIATGCHRVGTLEEYHMIFSKEIYEEIESKGELTNHDAKNDPMTYLGTSENGTEMFLNKLVATAKKVIVIGSVEPHYFAGYTGGRKAFLPGVAKYDTIEQNHKLALSQKAQALALAGNPVHEDMIDAMKVLKDIDVFSIQTVLDSKHRIYYASSGDLFESFDACVEKADEVFCVDIPRKADIVISVAPYPMDVDLYQAQKALDNGKLALAKDGILIMVAKCRTGIGPKPFFDLMASAPTPEEVLEKIQDEFHLGYHKAAKMAEISLWAQTWAVSDLTDDEMRAVHLKPYHDVQQALDDALAEKGPNASLIVLPFGSMSVPKVETV